MTPSRLAEIHRTCFTAPRPWSAQEFEDLLVNPSSVLVFQENGFALGRSMAGEAELITLAVLPEFRRQGIGETLVAELETKMREAGCSDMFLEVAEDNKAACGLYAHLGFSDAGKRKDYYQSINGPKISAIVMRKAL